VNTRQQTNEPAHLRDDEFVQLLNRYKKPLIRLIYCMVRNPTDADDIFQQAAVTIWEKFSDFEPGSDFFAWASSIARFKVRDFVKRKARRKVHFSDDLVDKLAAEQCELGLDDARLRALTQCRQKLSRDDQELLAAYYGNVNKVTDLAERCGCSASSIYINLRRIRRALLHCIQRTVSQEGFA
jgi:RNA polymerase sigma-70 factor, ECF subfamily